MLERSKCPLTNKNSQLIYSKSYSINELRALTSSHAHHLLKDKAFEIYYSPHADFYFQKWVLEDSELSLIYGNAEEKQDFESEIAEYKLHWYAHQTEEILVFRQLCHKKYPKVLDFGCNWGKWASMALAHGCDVYGIEVNAAAKTFCASRGIKMLELSQLKEMRFDFINCDQVLEHVADPMSLMKMFRHCLNKNGFLKISTPCNAKLPKVLKTGNVELLNSRTIDSLYPLVHINLFTRKTFEVMGKELGLELYNLPFWKCFGAGQLWNLPRQLNRNLRTPFKRWRGRDTYAWFTS